MHDACPHWLPGEKKRKKLKQADSFTKEKPEGKEKKHKFINKH